VALHGVFLGHSDHSGGYVSALVCDVVRQCRRHENAAAVLSSFRSIQHSV
jgi:hypothetical protein